VGDILIQNEVEVHGLDAEGGGLVICGYECGGGACNAGTANHKRVDRGNEFAYR
jgi:hypothetical protein